MKNGLFDSNNNNKCNKRTFIKYYEYKKKIVKKENKNQLSRTYNNSSKMQKDKDAAKFFQNKNIEKQVYFKVKNKNINNINVNHNFIKKNNNNKNNNIFGIRYSRRARVIINKSKSIENYTNKTKKINYSKRSNKNE